MTMAPIPESEVQRLAALASYAVLDTGGGAEYDRLVRLAARVAECPVALISLIDETRQWFLARVGMEARETPRDWAFCAHALPEPDSMLIVPDARLDHRFADNPLVRGPAPVIAYAGIPLVTPEGFPLGTLCVIDHVPRMLDDDCHDALALLADMVMDRLESGRRRDATVWPGRAVPALSFLAV